MHMGTFGTRSKTALIGVHPNLVKVLEEAVKTSPVDFTITEGVRSLERQTALYRQGRGAPGPIVTHADGVRTKSNHQVKEDGYGHAVDLYPFVGGKVRVAEPDVPGLLHTIADHIKVTAAMLGIMITWGGDWKSPVDPPHFELKQK